MTITRTMFLLVALLTPISDRITLFLEVKAGAITIHHTCTLHASAPNLSGKSRRLLLLQYSAG